MGRVVLVTGVADPLGFRAARLLVDDPGIERVVGVDVLPPRGDLGGVRFVRADIRNPVIAKVLAVDDVDTVVHMSMGATSGRAGGRSSLKETNVIGTMQLLAACQRSDGVRNLVVKSATAVYGASARDPGLFTEDTPPRRLPQSGYAKDCSEVEGYVRGFSRRRPDVSITVLRWADVLGADVDSPLGQYLRLPVVPTVLGHDPRLQLLHPEDALAVVTRAAVTDLPGTYNVAGGGVLTLSQMLRRLGRASLPVPGVGVGPVGQALRRTSRLDLTPDQVALLTHGRVVDTTAVRDRFGYVPQWSTAATLGAFASAVGRGPLDTDRIQSVERRLADVYATARASLGGGSDG
jgi:UDP-glucose 4-epimerase